MGNPLEFGDEIWRQKTRVLGLSDGEEMLWSAIKRAQIPAVKEPRGLLRSDGNSRDGATVIPWAEGKLMAWDVTVPDTFAESHLSTAAEQGAAA